MGCSEILKHIMLKVFSGFSNSINYNEMQRNSLLKVINTPSSTAPCKDQSAGNTGVAFVKGANQRNDFFENINNNV